MKYLKENKWNTKNQNIALNPIKPIDNNNNMGRFVQLIMGPAGVGKSSYCKTIQDYSKVIHRITHIGNLDPAAENFQYEAAFDIRDHIHIEDVMIDGGFGPNGGLVFCMEYLLQHYDWLQEELDSFGDDEYIILDCPGQIELYSHLPIMKELVKLIESWGYKSVAVYILDALFVLEPTKFLSGCMLSLSCMLQLQLPHVGIISKCDLADKEMIEKVLEYQSCEDILSNDIVSSGKLKSLSKAIGNVIDDFMMVSFVMLDITDDESIENVMYRIDNCVQYGEDLEPPEPKDDDADDDDDDMIN